MNGESVEVSALDIVEEHIRNVMRQVAERKQHEVNTHVRSAVKAASQRAGREAILEKQQFKERVDAAVRGAKERSAAPVTSAEAKKRCEVEARIHAALKAAKARQCAQDLGITQDNELQSWPPSCASMRNPLEAQSVLAQPTCQNDWGWQAPPRLPELIQKTPMEESLKVPLHSSAWATPCSPDWSRYLEEVNAATTATQSVDSVDSSSDADDSDALLASCWPGPEGV